MTAPNDWKQTERQRVRAAIAGAVLALDPDLFNDIARENGRAPAHLREALRQGTLDDDTLYEVAESVCAPVSEDENAGLHADWTLFADLLEDADLTSRGFPGYFIPATEALRAQEVFTHLLEVHGTADLAVCRTARDLLAGRRRFTMSAMRTTWDEALMLLDLYRPPPDEIDEDFPDEPPPQPTAPQAVIQAAQEFTAYLSEALEQEDNARWPALMEEEATPTSRAWDALHAENRDAWVERLLPTFKPKIDRSATRRAKKEGVSVEDLKRRCLYAGLTLAFADAQKNWVPRKDSKRAPIVPGRDLPLGELREWIDREARRLALLDLRPNEARTTDALDKRKLQGPEALEKAKDRRALEDDDFSDHAYEFTENFVANRALSELYRRVQPADHAVLHLWATGTRPQDIARKLGRTPNAVHQSIARIKRLGRDVRREAEEADPQ